MNKVIVLLLSLLLTLGLFAGCAATAEEPAAEPTELIVFAAASMTETLTELGEKYMAANENIKLIFTFDSSGTLKTQIEEGAECDVFISAGQKHAPANPPLQRSTGVLSCGCGFHLFTQVCRTEVIR